MTLSISGTVSAQPTSSTFPTPAPTSTEQAPQPQSSADTVTLSELAQSQAAQVSQLTAQGESPSQIAEALDIPLATVDLDLGIVAQPAPAQTASSPATAAHSAAAATMS